MPSAAVSVVTDSAFVCDPLSVRVQHLTTASPVTKSHVAGIVRKHAPGKSPVLYQRYGHVVLVHPNPVLFYQVAPHETRVLVDVPAEHVSQEDGALQRYFTDVVAPQLPEGAMREGFLAAVADQEPSVMPNRAMWAQPPTMTGAILIGDAWNTRHPLTGGGMTVCLRDVEILTRALLPVKDMANFKVPSPFAPLLHCASRSHSRS